jgi:hypothetical protein
MVILIRFLAPRKGVQLALHLAVFVGADAETNFLYHAGFEGDYVIVIVGGAETLFPPLLVINNDFGIASRDIRVNG